MLAKVFMPCFFLLIATLCHAAPKKQPFKPYHYNYDVGSHYKEEERYEDGTVRGSYGYTGPDGIYREVHYVADHNGFRAEIKTNEPGTANESPANVLMNSEFESLRLRPLAAKEEKSKEEETYENDEEEEEEKSSVESRNNRGGLKRTSKKNYSFFRFGKRHGGHE